MADEALAKAGLYFDELNKICVVKPQTAQNCNELQEECGDFVNRIKKFQELVDGLISLIDNLSKQVEEEKMKAIGSRNQIKSVSKQNEADIQQLQSLIREKQIELERLRIEHESLLRQEAEQKENLQQFLSPL